MDKKDLIEFADEYLEEKGITVSPSTHSVLVSSKYLNEFSLSNMDKEDIKENIIILMDETIDKYRERTSTSRRPTKIMDKDIRPAMKKRFCNLPPFCKCDE